MEIDNMITELTPGQRAVHLGTLARQRSVHDISIVTTGEVVIAAGHVVTDDVAALLVGDNGVWYWSNDPYFWGFVGRRVRLIRLANQANVYFVEEAPG